MTKIVLTIDVEERLLFGVETTTCKHFSCIECFAHWNDFQVLNVVIENDSILLGMENCTTEISDFDHCVKKLKIVALSILLKTYDVVLT